MVMVSSPHVIGHGPHPSCIIWVWHPPHTTHMGEHIMYTPSNHIHGHACTPMAHIGNNDACIPHITKTHDDAWNDTHAYNMVSSMIDATIYYNGDNHDIMHVDAHIMDGIMVNNTIVIVLGNGQTINVQVSMGDNVCVICHDNTQPLIMNDDAWVHESCMNDDGIPCMACGTITQRVTCTCYM